MVSLTSSYQYLGRSSVMTSTGGTLSYYLLLYGKTTANQTTGIHTVTTKAVLASTNDRATYYYYAQAHSGTINGATAFSGTNKPSSDWDKTAFTAGGVTYKTSTMLGEGSVNVDATNGSAKNITVSCYYAFNDTPNSYTPAKGTNRTVSVTVTLDAILRATTPTLSATSVTMGESVTITLSPVNSTFKHKLRYNFVDAISWATGMSIGSDFSAAGNVTATFTPPTSLSSKIPNSNSATCSVICYTYLSDGTLIGTKSVDITLSVPSYNLTADITTIGNNLLNGEYVEGKSTLTANITVTTPNLYGATIKRYSSTIDGVNYLGANFTTNTFKKGSQILTTVITDTRGKQVTVTTPSSIVVREYFLPQITSFTIARRVGDESTVDATVDGTVASINNKNTKTITVTLGDDTKAIDSNGKTTFTDISTDKTFIAIATITDSYTSVSKDNVLPTVAVTMDFWRDGNGIAMGKVAEEGELLDVAWRIKNSSVPSLIGGLGTSIPSNSDLNTVSFINPGNYVCPSNAIAKTVTNTPTKYAFKMCVHNVTNAYADASNQWTYLVREITNYQGERWIQNVNKDTGSWVFSPWCLMMNTSNVKDYIIEQGTYSDGWEYIKWANGRIELWADKSIEFPEPANMGNYLWRSMYNLDMSSKLKSIISGTCCVQYNGMLPTFSRHSTTLTMGEIVIATSKSFTKFTTTVPIYIIGKWK